MRTRRGLMLLGLQVLGLLGMAGASQPAIAGEPVRFALVVAKSSPVGDISFYDLKRLYMGEPLNVAGTRLVPLNAPPSSDSRTRFDHAVLGMSPEVVSRYWIDRKIRGQSGAPKSIETPELLQRVVARLDGAIGYVRISELQDEVKVVRVGGKAPNEPGYPVAH